MRTNLQNLNQPPSIFAERYPIALAAGLLDFAFLMGAAYLSHWWRFDTWTMGESYVLASLAYALFIIISQIATHSYSSWRGQSFGQPFKRVLIAWAFALLVLSLIAIGTQLAHFFSRQWMSATLALSFGAIFAFRLLVYFVLGFIRAKGRNQKNVLVISDDGQSHPVFGMLDQLPRSGYSVRSTITTAKNSDFISELHDAFKLSPPHEIWICLSFAEADKITAILHACRHQTADIRFFPDLSNLALLNHRINHIAGLYSIDISCSPMDGSHRLLKRALDLVLGTVISLLVLPVCVAIYLAIKLTSPGPVLFKQHRTGINGKTFKVYKFRSMEVHNEQDGTVTQASANDPRVTQLGAFLRKTSLDELPQFYNVLQGRMSIVGPRPHALAHNDYYKDLIETYMRRHKVKPGITGWAQINGLRGETNTLEKMEKRVEYDLWYINNWSVWLDLKIIALTIFKGFINNKP